MTAKQSRHLVVVYHEGCIDGLSSAWALHQKWGHDQHITINYIPYGHHKIAEAEKDILATLAPETELYFFDVSPEKKFLDTLLSPDAAAKPRAAEIQILDHHKTAAQELAQYTPPVSISASFTAPALDIRIDETCPSASRMIWEIMQPGKPVPAFIEMIDKMDRGEGLVTDDDFAAAAFIDSEKIVPVKQAFNTFAKLTKLDTAQMADKGRKIYEDQRNRIDRLNINLLYAELEILPGTAVRVPIINANVQNFGRSINNFLRDLGQKSGAGAAFAWHVDGNGCVTMGIRTNGTPDASKIAAHLCKTLGITGGGHDSSAAVHFPSLDHFCKNIRLEPAKPSKANDNTPAAPAQKKPPIQKP